MQIFELHFNPRSNKDKVFDTFVYNPEGLYEERLGNLCMAGELEKQLVRNSGFLSELSRALKDEYYSSQLKNTPEKNLKMAIQRANDFLNAETKNGNVGWLGNLNFAVVNYNDSMINFTKTGSIKILLVRRGEFLDIGENLEMQSDQEYPLKIFGNIASGKLMPLDKVLILTQEAFSIFSQNNDFLKNLDSANEEKALKEIINSHKNLFADLSGICLLIFVSPDTQPKRALTFQKELPVFNFSDFLLKPILLIKKPPLTLGMVRIKIKRKVLLILLLCLLLALSFIFFKR